MGRVEDGESVDDLGMIHRDGPGDGSAPVVTDHHRGLGAELSDETADVGGEQVDAVGLEVLRLRRQVVATRVGGDHPEARRRERLRSAAASRTRTPGSRAAGRAAAPRRPRRSASSGRRRRRSPRESRSGRPASGCVNVSASRFGAAGTEPGSDVSFPTCKLMTSPLSGQRCATAEVIGGRAPPGRITRIDGGTHRLRSHRW